VGPTYIGLCTYLLIYSKKCTFDFFFKIQFICHVVDFNSAIFHNLGPFKMNVHNNQDQSLDFRKWLEIIHNATWWILVLWNNIITNHWNYMTWICSTCKINVHVIILVLWMLTCVPRWMLFISPIDQVV
jgi:hypothetical protein